MTLSIKSYSPHRQSPASSPVFHYAPAVRSPGSPLSRRASKSRIANPTPPPIKPQYVDAATQWSPIVSVKMNSPPGDPSDSKIVQKAGIKPDMAMSTPPIVTATSTTSSSPRSPAPAPESPGMKRRQAEPPSPVPARQSEPEIVQKRSRPDQRPIKTLPSKYELCPIEDMVIIIADMIQELINTNDSLPLRGGVLTRFHSRTPPGISVLDYLQRLAKHATLIQPILLSMVYYIDRLCSLYPAFTVNSLTIHRFLITAATVASKGLSDSFWNNTTYARVGGIKVGELGLLELEFLYRLDWKIVPNPESLVEYYQGLTARISGYVLEEQESSSELDEDEDDDDSGMNEDSGAKTGEATDEKWKAWMDDVASHTTRVPPNDESS